MLDLVLMWHYCSITLGIGLGFVIAYMILWIFRGLVYVLTPKPPRELTADLGPDMTDDEFQKRLKKNMELFDDEKKEE